jgi:hypothetical protein
MNIGVVAHVAAGFLAALATIWYPALGVVATLLFLVYELDEQWRLSDVAYEQILEYSVGYYLGIAVAITMKILGIT